MTMLHALILSILKDKDATVPLKAMTVIEIGEICDTVKTNTIHKNITELMKNGLIEKGYKNGRALTYYINQKGIEFLEQMKQGK